MKIFKLILVSLFFIGVFCFPQIIKAEEKHPTLLFKNFEDTPGQKYYNEHPYSSIRESAISYARTYDLTKDFSDPNMSYGREIYRAEAGRRLAWAYQLSGDVVFAEKLATDVIPYIYTSPKDNNKVGKLSGDVLIDHLIEFDLIHNYLQENYPNVLSVARQKLMDRINWNYDGTIDITNAHSSIVLYSALGMSATCFPDESNSSKWLDMATEKLCINHPQFNRPVLQCNHNSGGLTLITSYRSYWIEQLCLWCSVSKVNYTQLLTDKYPLLKNVIMSAFWNKLPDGRNANFNTSGNNLLGYVYLYAPILPDLEQKYVLWHINKFLGINNVRSYIPSHMSYCFYDIHDFEIEEPMWTTYISSDAESSVFRKNWTEESDYLWFKHQKYPIASNRYMMHHDNMSFEYYSRGDLLLNDCGEVKSLTVGYGPTEAKGHNTILINNGTGTLGGPIKGDSSLTDFYNQVDLKNSFIKNWMELTEAEMDWKYIEDWDSGYYYLKKLLSNSVDWKRSILYPNKEYFIVIDNLIGSQKRDIHNLFHFSSFNKNETKEKDENGDWIHGNVIGDLKINNSSIDWTSQDYGVEYNYNVNNLIEWNTNKVKLKLFSVPASNISVEKWWARIGGYNRADEVDHPIIRFKTNASSLSRITTLLSRSNSEEEKNTEEIAVIGNGNAIKITSSTYEDYIYSGNGNSSFANLVTDADIFYFRKSNQPSNFTFLRGSYINYSDELLFKVSKKVDYSTFEYQGENKEFEIKGSGSADIYIYQMNPNISYQVRRDGELYSNWKMENNETVMIITTNLSEHNFQIGPDLPIEIGIISGSVIDQNTGIAIKEVDISDGTRTVNTNTSGKYTISNVPVGKYNLTAEKNDYENAFKNNVEVKKDQTLIVNFQLKSIKKYILKIKLKFLGKSFKKGDSKLTIYLYKHNQTNKEYEEEKNCQDKDCDFDFSDIALSKDQAYDILIKVPYFLSKKITNKLLDDEIDFEKQGIELICGDLNQDNIINSLDYATMKGKWQEQDSISDINEDNIVNAVDFSWLNRNWLVSGD